MSFDIENLKENNSDLLTLLTEHLPDMLWVKDLNGIYLYANKSICDGLLMAKDTQEPIGKGDVFFALRERAAHSDKPNWHTFGELCFNSDQEVIDNNKAMKFEEYGNVKGKLLYLEVYKAPFYDKDGKIIGTVGAGRDITQLKKTQIDLENSLKILDEQKKEMIYLENHDSLTDLPNKALFMDRLEQSISLAKKNKSKVAILCIDLDHFKEINDSLGHEIGDKVLLEVSHRMKKEIDESVTISRFGGDEFSLILNNIQNIDEVINKILKLMKVLEEPITIDTNTLYVSMSIGASLYPSDGKSANILLKNADAAMFKAKNDGRNTYSFYDENMTQKAYERIFLETALRQALETDEFVVYYQPQIDAKENKLIGMEALVRWEHKTMGLVFPDKFIPLAEMTGMIVKLDRLVMKKAFEQHSKWHKAGYNHGKLSLNLSIKQLEEDDFIDFVKSLLSDRECIANHIEFEVTESQIMANPDKSIKVLQELNDLGISISVDDFGTGYSSLSYLKKLPISKLKIDRSFVMDLPNDMDDVAISKTIINLCQGLNLNVIAEGVETKEQRDFLLENGCNYIQGYLYSRPIPADEMTKFIVDFEE